MAQTQASNARYKLIPVGLVAALLLALHQPGQEGYKHVPYRDSVGVWTVCGGIAGASVDPKHVYTDAECNQRETEYAMNMGRVYASCITEPLTWNEWFAYMHFGWNVGPRGFCNSGALKLVNAGKHTEACHALGNWYRAGGRDCRIRANNCYGVWTRRQWEIDLCLQ